VRSELWRYIRQSIETYTDLQDFAKKTLALCHYPTLGMPKLTDDILASLTLMRSIVVPLISIEKASVKDTEFWESFEAELGNLYSKHGPDRKSDAWLSWEKETTKADNTQLDKFQASASEVIHTAKC